MDRQSLIWIWLMLGGALAGSGITMVASAITYIVLQRFPSAEAKYAMFGGLSVSALIGIAYVAVSAIKDNHKEATTSEDSFPGFGSLGDKSNGQ